MLSVSNKYRQLINNDKREYVIKVEMTLKNNKKLTITNDDIWDGGLKLEQATSDPNSLTIGSAIIGKCTIVLNNIYEKYSAYDFFNADVVVYLGLIDDNNDDGSQKLYRMGFYTVDETSYDGSLVTLNCLDNMWKLDTPFDSSKVSFPTTAGVLINEICRQSNITFASSSFDERNKEIPVKPEQELNCREVLQYVAQICCKYCKVNTAGQLILGWYDKDISQYLVTYNGGTFLTDSTPYSDGADINGGTFAYNDGDNIDCGTFNDFDNIAYLSKHSGSNVSTDDITVTGCKVKCSVNNEEYETLYVDSQVELTHPRYVLVIENNPFITTQTYADSVANYVGGVLSGLTLRGFACSSLADFSIESGDICAIIDFRGNRYVSFVTNLSFATNNYENFSCGVESIRQNLVTRYSENVRSVYEATKNAQKILSDYDKAVQEMNKLANDALGYNKYERTASSGVITYLYSGNQIDTSDPNKPLFPNSANVFMISGDGVFISSDGGVTYTNGYDANSGTAILNLIYANGINCDWIKAGTLTLGGVNNVNGKLVVKNALNEIIGQWSTDGIDIKEGSFETKDGQVVSKSQSDNAFSRLNNSVIEVGYLSDYGEYESFGGISAIDTPSKAMRMSSESGRASIEVRENGNVEVSSGDTLYLNVDNLKMNNKTGASGVFYDSDGSSMVFENGILVDN